MIGVQVQIVRYADDAQPGWVECHLIDAHGRRWSFLQKVPIVTEAALDQQSEYPQPGILACEVVTRHEGVVRIDTTQPWDIDSIEGEKQFDVQESLLVEVDWYL
ncbi:hypothetical protein [Polyangium mundeleinium]|uniref:Uncharacterized protein n=1 Tax=Polyangium mundeleinium TaxID=2995306 RepID=A0ABT5F038_9BACT|nr:hypothetical protein [Polyangium mundeleinium]MDC0747452.1 hypothetical protein [Polyangium mundeleinium]